MSKQEFTFFFKNIIKLIEEATLYYNNKYNNSISIIKQVEFILI